MEALADSEPKYAEGDRIAYANCYGVVQNIETERGKVKVVFKLDGQNPTYTVDQDSKAIRRTQGRSR